MSATSFNELGLSPEILRAVTEAGYTTPTPIQAQAIPVVMAGLDVMGGAQTGTGKTAGFAPADPAAPAAASQHQPVPCPPSGPRADPGADPRTRDPGRGSDQGIRQVHRPAVDLRVRRRRHQAAAAIVRAGVEILVATPGRLLDHIEHKSVNLGQVEVFVLDEADRMLDMGFIPDIKRIMALLPATAKRQNLLFSATFSNEIKKLADQLLNEPQLIEVARRNEAADTVTQRAYKCPQDAKRALLTQSSSRATSGRCCASCAPSTARRASRGNSRRTASSPKRSTATRRSRRASRRCPSSRKASCRCWSPPTSPRAASTSTTCRSSSTTNCRTRPKTTCTASAAPAARARSGEAISFVAPEEEKYLAEIERMLKKKVADETAEGFDPVAAGARVAVAGARRTLATRRAAPRHAVATRNGASAACRARAANAQRHRARTPAANGVVPKGAASASGSATRPMPAIPTSPSCIDAGMRTRKSALMHGAGSHAMAPAGKARPGVAHEAPRAGTRERLTVRRRAAAPCRPVAFPPASTHARRALRRRRVLSRRLRAECARDLGACGSRRRCDRGGAGLVPGLVDRCRCRSLAPRVIATRWRAAPDLCARNLPRGGSARAGRARPHHADRRVARAIGVRCGRVARISRHQRRQGAVAAVPRAWSR